MSFQGLRPRWSWSSRARKTTTTIRSTSEMGTSTDWETTSTKKSKATSSNLRSSLPLASQPSSVSSCASEPKDPAESHSSLKVSRPPRKFNNYYVDILLNLQPQPRDQAHHHQDGYIRCPLCSWRPALPVHVPPRQEQGRRY